MLPKKSYCEDCEHSSPGSHPDAHLSVERGASRRLAKGGAEIAPVRQFF